jgi:hypothetical protein
MSGVSSLVARPFVMLRLTIPCLSVETRQYAIHDLAAAIGNNGDKEFLKSGSFSHYND